ncbi:conserved hypothetical protein [Culex quinquefasciatus]|uniref:Ig-like domain-containing protein n=1 Tax=Culex quinquefasciatus TaxID=7176 RepID=B0XDI4_CULQU|nr:conserved hypothetical protein [Culex quinquefasciatus]|eukprot:XP_001867706.1 conserved hypothetical protein [Culex quinquefasciatus]
MSVCIADTRGRDVTSAKRWSDETVFGQRAYFLFDKQPGELAVQNAREPDSGVYRCRVDFIVAQTRNSIVNLTIIERVRLLELTKQKQQNRWVYIPTER